MVAHEEKQITFEELIKLDKELANADFMHEQDVASVASDVTAKLKKICTIYKSIKPVLSVINSIPFMPSNVKAAIKAFRAVLDTVC